MLSERKEWPISLVIPMIWIERTLLVSGSLGDPATEPAHAREFEMDYLED